MRHLQLGVGHRPPGHLAIATSDVICLVTRSPQPMLRCSSCAYFQGMLVGPDPCVLCAAPTRGAARAAPRHGRSVLVFDEDCPDD